MAKYQVLGLVPQEHDENDQKLSEGEQKVNEAPVVYETDNEEQARQINRQGGFTGPGGEWIVVTGIRDTSGAAPAKPPLEK